jgi:hypothetical protein
MRGKVIVLLIAMTVLMTTAATWASQIDNEYVYSISKALFENYTFAELDNFHEQDVIHAARELGFQRELTEAEVIKLRCIIGAIEMPYVSPLWHEGYTPTPTGKPARPEITLGKVDGSNAFDLVWQNDGVADSAKYAISDIATTGPDNEFLNKQTTTVTLRYGITTSLRNTQRQTRHTPGQHGLSWAIWTATETWTSSAAFGA